MLTTFSERILYFKDLEIDYIHKKERFFCCFIAILFVVCIFLVKEIL